MSQLRALLASAGFWGIFVPALVTAIGFIWNERSKLRWEQFKRKEERYHNMLTLLRGFCTSSHSKEDKDRFLEELNQCWLYAPDEIIKLAYAFLESVHAGAQTSDEEKQERVGDLVAAIRHDLIRRSIMSRTRLTGQDFKLLRAT